MVWRYMVVCDIYCVLYVCVVYDVCVIWCEKCEREVCCGDIQCGLCMCFLVICHMRCVIHGMCVYYVWCEARVYMIYCMYICDIC